MQETMQLERCPYDGTTIAAEHFSGGSMLLRCEHCGAAWEWHNAWVRRVAEPDRSRVRTEPGERVSPAGDALP